MISDGLKIMAMLFVALLIAWIGEPAVAFVLGTLGNYPPGGNVVGLLLIAGLGVLAVFLVVRLLMGTFKRAVLFIVAVALFVLFMIGAALHWPV